MLKYAKAIDNHIRSKFGFVKGTKASHDSITYRIGKIYCTVRYESFTARGGWLLHYDIYAPKWKSVCIECFPEHVEISMTGPSRYGSNRIILTWEQPDLLDLIEAEIEVLIQPQS